ncbi:MAG TPA: hypothetical protein VFU88_08920 [Ktedonobacterales bacterium]|nr:hypothetical protein [Ktedonobacterales bacterium]
MKRRLLLTILVVDGLLVLAELGLYIADQLSDVPCTPIRLFRYNDCSVYFKIFYPAEAVLLTWGIGTLPVVLVIFGDWLATALRGLRRTNHGRGHPDM